MMRAAVQCVGREDTKERVARMVEGIVEDIDGNEEVAASLKIEFGGDAGVMRQVDIRPNPNGPVMFKSFVTWDSDRELWLVFIEGALENHWEQRNVPTDVN